MRPLVEPSNKVWRYSTHTKTLEPHFKIGDSPRYTNQGQNELVELIGINTIYNDFPNYTINFMQVNSK